MFFGVPTYAGQCLEYGPQYGVYYEKGILMDDCGSTNHELYHTGSGGSP